MEKDDILADQYTEYYYLNGDPKPYVEVDETGNSKLSPIIDTPRGITDEQLVNFLRIVKGFEQANILPQIKSNDDKREVVKLKEGIKTLLAIDINNRKLSSVRESSLRVTHGRGGYTIEDAQSMINACNIADGLYDIADSLNYKSAKEAFSNLSPEIKGYVIEKITNGLNSLRTTKPVYWNDGINFEINKYYGFYDGGKQLIHHGVYTSEQLKENGTEHFSKGKYIAFPLNFAGLLDSDYALRMQHVISTLDKLTKVSAVKDETFIDAPLYEMYLTNPEAISNLFDSLVGLLEAGNQYSDLNGKLKSNVMTIIGRMLSPDNISSQNLLQIFTNQESKFLSRLKKSGVVDKEQADRSIEAVVESMSRKVLPLIKSNPELISIIFHSNPDFINKANKAAAKKINGKEELSYTQTKNLVNFVGLTIAEKLKNDSEIKNIIKEKSDNGKKIVKLSQIEAEIRQRYAIEADGIFQKGADIALALSQTISQRGEIAPKRSNDPLITSLLSGKTLEFFKDEVLFRPQSNL
jgi:hypothetical protein